MRDNKFTIIQIGKIVKDVTGNCLKIFEKYKEAFLELENYSHIHVYCWANKFDNIEGRTILSAPVPYSREKVIAGVFACRSPVRFNLIMDSLCKINKIIKNKGKIFIENIDAAPDTPIIDIKPYVGVCDRVEKLKFQNGFQKNGVDGCRKEGLARMDILNKIRIELEENSDIKTRESAQKFFKEKINFYGVKVSIVTKIAKESYKEIKKYPKKEIFSLCNELLKSKYIEESFIAFKWAAYIKTYEPRDFRVLGRWLRDDVTNWASCDTLCNHALGSFIEQYPQEIEHLKRWTKHKNRWMRRGAAVTLILPARKGKFLNDIFEIAQLLLEDQDDLVQKGYGWLLKEASKKHQRQVFDFILKHKKTMPRTALRYAIEKMPEKLRKEAMRK